MTLSAIGSLTHVLHEAAVAGTVGTELPIYITEYGIQSRPDPLGVPLQTQADWLSHLRAARLRLSAGAYLRAVPDAR